MSEHTEKRAAGGMPQGEAMQRNVARRRAKGKIWRGVFLSSTLIGLVALALLLFTIINDSFGLIAVEYKVDPATLAERPLDELSKDELTAVLQGNISKNAFRTLERDKPMADRSADDVLGLIYERVVKQDVARTWTLSDSTFNRAAIEAEVAKDFPEAKLEFRSWLSGGFLTTPMSSNALIAGVRTALFGSLWMIGITILFAFPIGVGAAIYLEEYASDNRFNRIIQTNINNLAGVPSIIYGMLGLAVFVRLFEPVTSGKVFGVEGGNGRTILSASLTMMLLILPIIIINAQEAIRAVPLSLRQASYGLGATKWQTIRHHVLPNALPGILTGTILAV
ncbi:MAG TPA: ABC transporter permease subunit, partial [Herpetosiphonaceae bacterium]|nr:ABC transporter permease subunit [Herpetosiphonaceae bacterium]